MQETVTYDVLVLLQRITLKEIKSHPWFVKNLPRELTEAAQNAYYQKETPTFSPQCVEEMHVNAKGKVTTLGKKIWFFLFL